MTAKEMTPSARAFSEKPRIALSPHFAAGGNVEIYFTVEPLRGNRVAEKRR